MSDTNTNTKTHTKESKSNSTQKKPTFPTWALWAFGSTISYGLSGFLIYVLNKKHGGVNSTALDLLVYLLITFYLGALYLAQKKGIWKKFSDAQFFKNYDKDLQTIFTNKNHIFFAVFISLTTVVANIFLYSSYLDAPNPGFSDTISSFYSLFSVILGVLFFGAKFHLINALGVLLVIFSGYLILT